MKIYSFERIQLLPIDITTAWEFFSSPKNLRTITPDYLSFEITGDALPDKMYTGTIITYTIKPLFGIPVTWATEIKHISESKFFVDEQRFGPYHFWHHKHFFREITGGVEMRDLVHYVLPFGIFGQMAHALFVSKQLEGIFKYREEKLTEIFGRYITELRKK